MLVDDSDEARNMLGGGASSVDGGRVLARGRARRQRATEADRGSVGAGVAEAQAGLLGGRGARVSATWSSCAAVLFAAADTPSSSHCVLAHSTCPWFVSSVPRPSATMQSLPSVLQESHPQEPYSDNRSSYSLATVHDDPSPSQSTALLASARADRSYGTASPAQPSSRRILMNATLKMAVIFIVSTAVLGVTLWLALPTLEE